jgi:hypothetical protein
MRSKCNKTSYIRTLLFYNINILDNNQFMASKRSTGSILDFFSKKSKAQGSPLSTEEIPLVDIADL